MRNEQVTAASTLIQISDKEFEVWPLSDKDLDSLTQWFCYKTKQEAFEQSQFAETRALARSILEGAVEYCLKAQWHQSAEINKILQTPEGLVHCIYLMTKRGYKKDWFLNKFGTSSELTEQQLRNRLAVQKAFLDQNTVEVEEEEKEDDDSSSKKKKSVNPISTES